MNVLSQLLMPLSYLRIRHPKKVVFDYTIPALVAAAGWSFLVFVVETPILFGQDGLVTGVNALLQMLIGFYIAALAAIATFQKPGMDDAMLGDSPTLEEEFRGHRELVKLTRRRFLCLLFGYLSWTSLAIYFAGVLTAATRHALLHNVSLELLPLVKNGLLLVYIFLLANLCVTTMLGLYYMAHRIHLSDPKELAATNSSAAVAPKSP